MKYDRGNALWQRLMLERVYSVHVDINEDYLGGLEHTALGTGYTLCNDFYLTPKMSCNVHGTLELKGMSNKGYRHFDKPEHGENRWSNDRHMITLYDSDQFYLIKLQTINESFTEKLERLRLEKDLLEHNFQKLVDEWALGYLEHATSDERAAHKNKQRRVAALIDKKKAEYFAQLSV